MSVEANASTSAVCALARWEDAGAHWRVETIDGDHAVISLLACTGEVVDHLTSSDPQLLAYVAMRPSSETDRPSRANHEASEAPQNKTAHARRFARGTEAAT